MTKSPTNPNKKRVFYRVDAECQNCGKVNEEVAVPMKRRFKSYNPTINEAGKPIEYASAYLSQSNEWMPIFCGNCKLAFLVLRKGGTYDNPH